MTTQTAEIALNDWILASPVTRAVWVIDRNNGKWRVGLCVGPDHFAERLIPGVDTEYPRAVLNALEIAKLAGYG